MSSVTVTVDDFDPLFRYSDYTQWQTPNPQDNPTWWNAGSQGTGSPWHQATYHSTTVQGASVSFNFTGSSFKLYGAGGPTDTNYTITIDPSLPQPFSQSYNTQNASEGRTVLYSTDALTPSPHQVQITNHGSGLLLDLAEFTVEVGAQGATMSNTTVQNDDPKMVYAGAWTTQSGPNFNGGTSTYTSGPGNSVSLAFEGSAVYMYGDQVNDHGEYIVYLNGTAQAGYTGRSGCGGGYAKYCEKLHGLVAFFGGLPHGTHNITVVNGGPSEGDVTYFDFDYVEYTTPSVYSVQNAASNPCPFTTCNGTGTTSAGPSGVAPVSSGPSATSPSPSAASSPAAGLQGAAVLRSEAGTGMLIAVCAMWMIKKLF